jgi:tol-pal system protein YbgF
MAYAGKTPRPFPGAGCFVCGNDFISNGFYTGISADGTIKTGMEESMSKNYKSFFRRFLILPSAVVLVLLAGACATSQDVMTVYRQGEQIELRQNALDARVKGLESGLQQNKRELAQEMESLRDSMAQMRILVDNVRTEMRDVSGRLEETGFFMESKVGSLLEEKEEKEQSLILLSARVAQLDDQLTRLEAYMGLDEDSRVEAVKPQGNEPEAGPMETLDEQPAYEYAKQTFDQGHMEAARNQFRAFLKRFPNSGLADNAYFWIGESFFLEKWYEKAILEYQSVIEKYPKGNKVPSALLKQGMAFARIDDKTNARLILNELIKKHPGSPEALLAKRTLDNL